MNINDFYDSSDIRTYLKTPFQLNGRTVACNGHAFISMQKHGTYPPCPHDSIARFEAIMMMIDDRRDYVSIPNNLTFPEDHQCKVCDGHGKATLNKCEECDGDGTVEISNDFNDYECECKSCDGDGNHITKGGDYDCENCSGTGRAYMVNSKVDVLGVYINPKILNYIVNEPDIELSPEPAEKKLFFRAGENKGLIMGMHK